MGTFSDAREKRRKLLFQFFRKRHAVVISKLANPEELLTRHTTENLMDKKPKDGEIKNEVEKVSPKSEEGHQSRFGLGLEDTYDPDTQSLLDEIMAHNHGWRK